MRGFAISFAAIFISLLAGASKGDEVAGYAIFRHDEDRKCSASLLFGTKQGRDANITYFVFDDGRTDEVYFGLRPNGKFDPATLVSEPVAVMVDEDMVLSGPGGPDFSGLISLPSVTNGQSSEFIKALSAGQELVIVLQETEQQLVINLNDLRTARVALAKCVEESNANS